MPHYQVALPTPLFQSLTYACDAALSVGQMVVVPLRSTMMMGVVTQKESAYQGHTKDIQSVLPWVFNQKQINFLTWLSQYTMNPFGLCAKLMMPLPLKEFEKIIKKPTPLPKACHVNPSLDVILNPDQQEACRKIEEKRGTFVPFLLDGMTGSGKTEVYFHTIHRCLLDQKQALVLLPEIALTEQWVMRFEQRFGFKPDLWHSQITPKRRRELFEKIYSGAPCIVVGARSALFLPFQKLGIIVVDEEHDSSYKQEDQLIYNARDAAIVRAQHESCPIILASATPSLETYYNAVQGKYTLLSLKSRYGVEEMPSIHIIDRRDKKKSKAYISEPLQNAVGQALQRQEQSLLFVNRRGFAPLTLCQACGHRFECKSCSSWLTHHEKSSILKCHHCLDTQPYPKHCPQCGVKDAFVACGPGVERLYEEAKNLFPEARFLVMSSDMVDSPQKMKEAMAKIMNHDVDIIIGTQLMAKGHHFPKLTVVGAVDADMGLNGMDLRACEKTFQLLYQVAGRAGRDVLKGHIYLQTYNPDHPVIQNLKSYDKDAFLQAELDQREAFHMPPFSKMALITLSSRSIPDLDTATKILYTQQPSHEDIQILGPSVPHLAKVKGEHRKRFLLMTQKTGHRQNYIQQWVFQKKLPRTVRVYVDIDPLNFA
ncbi:MAG: Primosomal protein N' [Holosporales bacterium]